MDTALDRGADGRWHGTMTDRWWIGAGPNGGYIAAFLIRALMNEAAQPDPLTMTVHYLARPGIAAVTVEVDRLRGGRSHDFLHARLLQDEQPVAVATAAFGDRKSTRLNSSHRCISYAVFCLTKKNNQ